MNLFVIYIGGVTHNSNIEVHDLRFVVEDTIEDCYDELRRQWWGTPESLHIDCWGILNYADGYDIALKADSDQSSKKLYFLNLGGYDPTQFTEIHHNVFIVEETESKARAKALQGVENWKSPHRDVQIEVETAICLHEVVQKNNLSIHLVKTDKEKPFDFICRYIPI